MTKDIRNQLEVHVNDGPGDPEIPKPAGKFSLDKFKSTRAATIANVDVLQTALSVQRMSEAKDFVRLHPTEWTEELCFVSVPIKGAARESLHLIEEELALRFLPSKRIIRNRLALATKPFDKFFLCIVPSQNLENTWVSSNLLACEHAKTMWCQATSRKDEGVESYNVTLAEDPDAFPDPRWPKQGIHEIIGVTFAGRMILEPNDPGLARLRGMRVV